MTQYNVDKMYTYLKGYITGAGFTESMKALGYAREKHNGQFRKDGVTPYIAHPLQMACYAVALGVKDDYIIATILLHDVVEDCGVKYSELPVCDKVKEAVRYMTIEYIDGEEKAVTKARYFRNLLYNKTALVVKGLDRYMNLRTMAGTFEQARIEKNVKETANLLLPVMKQGKDKYPELADILYVLRENIRSVNDTLAAAYKIEI
jgi:GTP pyrophosphokinase